MNVRVHTMRALVSAGLVLFSAHTSSAQLKTAISPVQKLSPLADIGSRDVVATPLDTKEADQPANLPPPLFSLRLFQEKILSNVPVAYKGTVPLGGGGTKEITGGLRQKLVPVRSANSKSSTLTSSTTNSISKTTTALRSGSDSGVGAALDSAPLAQAMSGGENPNPLPPPSNVVLEGTYSVDIFANEVSCGGQHVPTFLSYQIGSQTPVPLFGGQPIQVTGKTSFDIPAGTIEPVAFIATFIPNPNCHSSTTKRSDDSNTSAVILDGMDISQLIADKNLNLAFAGQTPFTNLMLSNGYMNAQSIATLAANQNVIAIEADTHVTGASVDLNDIMFRVTAPGAQGVDVAMHDTIGPDTTATDLNLGAPTQEAPTHTTFSQPISQVVVPQNGVLSQFEVVGYFYQPNYNPQAWTYHLRIFPSLQAVWDHPLGGEGITHFQFGPSEVSLQEFGTPNAEAATSHTYLLTLDLSGMPTQVTAGQTIYVGLTVETPVGAAGSFRAVTSSISAPQDYLRTTSNFVPLTGLGTGKIGYRLTETVQQ